MCIHILTNTLDIAYFKKEMLYIYMLRDEVCHNTWADIGSELVGDAYN